VPAKTQVSQQGDAKPIVSIRPGPNRAGNLSPTLGRNWSRLFAVNPRLLLGREGFAASSSLKVSTPVQSGE
jgi:hypothetical protein